MHGFGIDVATHTACRLARGFAGSLTGQVGLDLAFLSHSNQHDKEQAGEDQSRSHAQYVSLSSTRVVKSGFEAKIILNFSEGKILARPALMIMLLFNSGRQRSPTPASTPLPRPSGKVTTFPFTDSRSSGVKSESSPVLINNIAGLT